MSAKSSVGCMYVGGVCILVRPSSLKDTEKSADLTQRGRLFTLRKEAEGGPTTNLCMFCGFPFRS